MGAWLGRWRNFRWDVVLGVGVTATIVLLLASAWAYQPVQNFGSCTASFREMTKLSGGVYICPRRYEHDWVAHTHAALAFTLLGLGVAAAAVSAGSLIALGARRDRPLATSS